MTLLALPGPSGDEGAVTEWLLSQVRQIAPGATWKRLGDNLLVLRGSPRAAIFAHQDTTGFTLGYRNELIPIGGPAPRHDDPIRSVSPGEDGSVVRGRLRVEGDDERHSTYRLHPEGNAPAEPGTRWVYDRKPAREGGFIVSPYLDNRAGIWAALRALERCPDIAVAFSTGEESHGHGARVCARWLYDKHEITQSLIADITWHTEETPCGGGAVISLRDAYAPRQAYLHRVITLADESGLPYTKEIQSSGSSDGGHINRGSVPMDWVFVGAPEENPHSSLERAALSDLDAMTDLLVYLVDRL